MAAKMIVVILIGVWGGQKLDIMLLNKVPWFTLLLSLVSVAAAIYIVIRDTRT
jgi:F0F1-type ATP synthase assembly protein I